MSDEGMSSRGASSQDARDKNTGKAKVAIAGVIAVLIALVAALSYAILAEDDTDGSVPDAAAGPWNAVFLTSGQVYFGHLSDTDDETFTLEDIYYLQVQQNLQPGPDSSAARDQQVSLAKLGKFELHCPVDQMSINRDQVLFWEELQPESRVVQAITEYVKTPDYQKGCYEGVAPAAPPASVTPPAPAG